MVGFIHKLFGRFINWLLGMNIIIFKCLCTCNMVIYCKY